MSTRLEGMKDEVYLPPAELAGVAHCSSLQQYNDMYKQSIDEPEAFWGQIAKQFHWKTPHSGKFYDYNFDASKGKVFIEWMRGATTNICYNALDRHVQAGDADRVAFFW